MFGRSKDKSKDKNDDNVTSDVDEATSATYDGSNGAEFPKMEDEVLTTGQDFDPDKDRPSPLTWKEARALKRARYEERIAHNDKFKKAYVIRNKRTNQVAEIRAASPLHAVNIIGWKAGKVELMGVVDILTPSDEPETVGSSSEVEVTINE